MKNFVNKLIRPDLFVALTTCVIFVLWLSLSLVATFVLHAPDWLIVFLWLLTSIILTYLIYLLILLVFYLKTRVKRVAKRNKLTQKFFENYEFRTIINTIFSVILSAFYIIAQIFACVLTRSAWYGALAGYSVVLMILRVGVIYKHFAHSKVADENDIECIKSYRNCGFYLFGLDLALTVFAVLMITTNQGFDYPGLLIYVVAVHTFYKLVMSIIHIIKAKQSDSFPAQTTRNLNFTSALVSILALQTAMFHSFSKNFDATLANALTGSGVAIGIIVLAVIMIINGQKALKNINDKSKK